MGGFRTRARLRIRSPLVIDRFWRRRLRMQEFRSRQAAIRAQLDRERTMSDALALVLVAQIVFDQDLVAGHAHDRS